MKLSKDAIAKIIMEFNAATYRKFGKYDFATGFLTSLLADALLQLSDDDRNKILNTILDADV